MTFGVHTGERGGMKRHFSLLVACAAIFLSLMSASVGAAEEALAGLDVYVLGQHAYVAGGASGGGSAE